MDYPGVLLWVDINKDYGSLHNYHQISTFKLTAVKNMYQRKMDQLGKIVILRTPFRPWYAEHHHQDA